jgi:hypothetical protein
MKPASATLHAASKKDDATDLQRPNELVRSASGGADRRCNHTTAPPSEVYDRSSDA